MRRTFNLNGLIVSKTTLFAVCFGVLAFCLSGPHCNWLKAKWIRFVGKVSFSAYLVHFALLETGWQFGVLYFLPRFDEFWSHLVDRPGYDFYAFVVLFPSFLATTVAISSVTYYLVERPFIELGSRIIQKFNLSIEKPTTY